MVTTRSGEDTRTGDKHDLSHGNNDTSPAAKRKRTDADDKTRQPTLEETIASKDESNEDVAEENAHESKDSPPGSTEPTAEHGQNMTAKQHDSDAIIPSSILEKGVIHFIARGRVDTDDPASIDDVARSFMLLNPIAADASLGEGPLPDKEASRLLVIPKKAPPTHGGDRLVAFVEKAGVSFQTLRDEFLPGNEYETKTQGTRHTPPATPLGEGVYALTTTGKESHLAYILTVPKELGKLQRQLGIRQQGSFIMSTKNPAFPGPAQFRLPNEPEFPKEILDEFASYRWVPTQPRHADFVNAQFLLVGERSGIDKATEPQEKDIAEGKEDPREVLEELEHDDAQRMKHLDADAGAAIFKDLHAFSERFAKT